MFKNRYYLAVLSILFVSFAKSLLSYKYGFRYGRLVTKTTYKAVRDYGLNRFYKR
jgi:hypothetical protein